MSDLRIDTNEDAGEDADTISEHELDAIFDPDALYNEGMAHYRRRRWRRAKACFDQVRQHQPNRRGVDALLRELDIFIQLESVESDARQEAPLDAEALLGLTEEPELEVMPEEEEETSHGRGWLIFGIMILTIIVVVGGVLWYSLGLPPFGDNESEDSLRNLAQAYLIAQQYDKALVTYNKLVAIVPNDPEAQNGLEKSKAGIYREALDYEKAGNLDEALTRYLGLADVDATYEDIGERIPTLTTTQALESLLAEAQQYLERRSYGDAEKKLLEIRSRDDGFRPGTISDDLFETYMGRALLYLDMVADDIKRDEGAKPTEPSYTVTSDTLSKVRQAMRDLAKALEERPSHPKAQETSGLASALDSGLTSYGEWSWASAIEALTPVFTQEPAYLKGKVGLILCDAHLHQGEFAASNGEYFSALQQFQAMIDLGVCDGEQAQQRADAVGIHLTPTATPTFTATPTNTPTNTPRPTATPTVTSTPTNTPEPTATQPPSGGSSGGGGSSSEPKATKKPRN